MRQRPQGVGHGSSEEAEVEEGSNQGDQQAPEGRKATEGLEGQDERGKAPGWVWEQHERLTEPLPHRRRLLGDGRGTQSSRCRQDASVCRDRARRQEGDGRELETVRAEGIAERGDWESGRPSSSAKRFRLVQKGLRKAA